MQIHRRMDILASTAMVAAGCAGPGSSSMAKDTSASRSLAQCDSTAKIGITDITSTSAKFVPPVACVSSGNASVTWRLLQSGYVFSANAVALKTGSYEGLQFQGPITDTNGKEYGANFYAASAATWQYSIKFQSAGDRPTYWLCDPTIVNHQDFIAPASSGTPCQSRDRPW